MTEYAQEVAIWREIGALEESVAELRGEMIIARADSIFWRWAGIVSLAAMAGLVLGLVSGVISIEPRDTGLIAACSMRGSI